MKRGDIELGTLYVVKDWNVPTERPVRFTSLTPTYATGFRQRPDALPAEYQAVDGTWKATKVRPRDVVDRWDNPKRVAERETLAVNRDKAERAREILRRHGLNVDDKESTYFGWDRFDAAVVGVRRSPIVSITIDAFLEHWS
jgi:hypothetical protein